MKQNQASYQQFWTSSGLSAIVQGVKIPDPSENIQNCLLVALGNFQLSNGQ